MHVRAYLCTSSDKRNIAHMPRAVSTLQNRTKQGGQPNVVEVKNKAAIVREGLIANGVNVSAWARDRGFDVNLVHHVLAGRRACMRGTSHAIAVALGIKGGEA